MERLGQSINNTIAHETGYTSRVTPAEAHRTSTAVPCGDSAQDIAGPEDMADMGRRGSTAEQAPLSAAKLAPVSFSISREASQKELLWSLPLDLSYQGNSFPIDPNGTIYVVDRHGEISAVDKEGKIQWSFKSRPDLERPLCAGRDGTLIETFQRPGSREDKEEFYLAGIKDGNKTWVSFTKLMLREHHSPIPDRPPVDDKGTLFINAGDFNDTMYAMEEGKVLWSARPDKTGGVNYPFTGQPVIASDGSVYNGTDDGSVYCFRDGRQLWKYSTGDTEGIQFPYITAGENGVVVVASGDTISALVNRTDMPEGLWSCKPGGHFECRPRVGKDGSFSIVSNEGTFYQIKDGRVERSYSLPPSLPGSGFVDIGPDGTVFAEDRKGALHVIRDEHSRSTITTDRHAQKTMVLGDDGTLYVAVEGKGLYAYGGF